MIEGPIRVLVVEDNPGDVRLVEKLLERAKGTYFEIEPASRVGDALQRLARGGLDAVLLDLGLPDSEPAQTFSKVHAAAGELPIIVLTGRDDEETALQAVRNGAQDYLVKRDIETDLLVRTIVYSIERKRSEQALRESEERYALAVHGANDGLWDWNLERNEIYFSPRWKLLLGYGKEEVGADPEEWFGRVHPEDLERLQRDIGAHREGRTPQFESEHRMRQKNGSYRWMLSRGIAVRGQSGSAYRIVGSMTDVHKRKLAEQRLLHDALHDALTGLPNWALFMDRLGVSIAHARRRRNYLFAVLYIDLDRFKNVNDTLGHAVGDQLIIALSRRLESILRPGDTLARLGGDEFAILVDDVGDPSNAKRVAERLHEELRQPFRLDSHEIFVSASVGIAMSSTGYERPDDVLRDADVAMYRAKSLGRGRHAIFDRQMHQRAVELLRLETDLRQAVERREFQIHYQPIVSLVSGEVEAFEALVRWNHPERGLVYPEDFITIAEETGLIVPLGWFVLQEACRQTADWQRQNGSAPLGISVNLSSKQLMQPDLIARIEAVLAETALRPRSLRLEITEEVLMERADAAVEKLLQLRGLNLPLYIDDFGSGYSSLGQLHELPTQAVKIDRSFVSQMAVGKERSRIVGTMVRLARDLGMRVVAEGLETGDQLAHLRKLECESGQGFYFSAPLDRAAAGALIESRHRW